MSDCCSPKGYKWVFSEKSARAEAKRYRRKGLDSTSRRIVDFLRTQGVGGKTLLEIGGGIGAIQIELLKAGASRAVSVELTPTYEDVAIELLREAGLEDRVERKVTDFAQAAGQVGSADIVILNRVICCYPDMPRLAGAAADHARQLLVMSFPRQTWWLSIGLGMGNFVLRVLRREFHIFLHPPKKIVATSRQHGLEPVLDKEGVIWVVAALRRVA
ncbi:MAG: methyltransferase domain-containing protein [Chloroflexi bacterium]|nr:MAG: methyltransferase domain-containing protein [Chloroflexota bacterium]TME04183.1 MAG: methyltransferase domain-containing protein [Chloroflexota bacterium]TME43172.1 MAG: methyltransferase domain-containing protein [Chloroflexota bacterium]TME51761.1 MAG: methyltransferase domain-containing protein [Chloroflexota bacterium]